jgi:hypothetical protein
LAIRICSCTLQRDNHADTDSVTIISVSK